MKQELIRNVGIIAHVDHGKTTLVDCLLKQSGMFRDSEVTGTCIMDSNELEKERGITIFSKNAAIEYKGHKINIVDTPGHADFGGEVERILKMVSGVLLLADAVEGPMPQTRFVLKKSLELGLKPIVVINKIDRPAARLEKVVDEVFDLFVDLGANDEQLDFSIIYTSAKQGISRINPEDEDRDITPLLDLILEKVPAHQGDSEGPFQMLVSSIDYDDYVGRIAIGTINRGSIQAKQTYTQINRQGDMESFSISKLYCYQGLSKVESPAAVTGDIIGIAGMKEVEIGETIADSSSPEPLPVIEIDEPTLSIHFSSNTSPFAGREGDLVTSRQVRDRLFRETRSNVSLRVEETDTQDTFKVSGRGELHLTILIETMRREGYEFSVSRPEVLIKDIDGVPHEPEEFVILDIDDSHVGSVMEAMGKRKATMKNMIQGETTARLEFVIPTRGLFGFRSEFLTLTKGTGIINRNFHNFIPHCGEIAQRTNGVLIAMENGNTTGFSLFNLQERGSMFLGPAEEIYTGMIVGTNKKDNDLVVNLCKEKKLSNMRASGSDVNIILTPPIIMSLEQVLGFLNEDELAEITPKSIRLRKKILNESDRKRFGRARNSIPVPVS
ncbi:MAG: translational GTPase TypA [Nitrospina sp.]|nr:translational GTPase TypA [Nitrospina sp.]MBT3510427.1 translational GTPase TypA [Nitrospina sp.]MBT3875812.1 translational GTPase TypA [Nitrospina sp.]MBT4049259.1 translational GTPase TypA [Nitrospina sp.]MBT4557227.1 translational GTPase TypA [Nitrospina sp.]